ncbi:tRNA uridine-5-carboxymethylaminomethyl(34) synthesis GTPase MnmE [Prevotella cerevisiae]|uniref:tRNA modification GTPase MnmE n=1 Tax=Segatella cerevisiae TaxID=2053716 RepID=A0ABT1BVT4_9BACT|nr:tRNA uridine-5-carboxymethylaminomethyl(34) synthesis GTPase MnmE [Segatella cerevisiae]MCO6025069.1 tRNA uridine-5-carboxymethylaminomethyl(34) synthesis GTPase MnmE [Segatella cerevisiae]
MDNDTICALATAAGGAIGIIRVSGKEAIAITDRIFRPAGIKSLSEAAANTVHYGEIIDQNKQVVDDVLVSVFRAPHSYTGEDSTEISCHGSRYVLGQVLKLLIDNGCRQAGPGEYTRRAYLNGKMDLSQAEAVADLVAATNRASHHLAISQLKGHFSSELGKLREQLLKMTSLVELELDFSDHEDLEFADRSQLKQLAQTIDENITRLARSFETGNALKNGIPVAIVGKTNVGKSTLLNQLLHEDKAIVSDIDGTTRDAIEDTTEIHGLTFRFIDTAGLRKTDDQVEKLGIELTYKKIEEAAIVLWIVDCQPSDREIEDIRSRTKGKSLILVRNKIDKDSSSVKVPPTIPVVLLSAKTGTHIPDLEEKLYVAANIPEINENTVIVTSARHYNALMAGKESIERVLQGLKDNLSGDLLSEDLRICLNQLGEITGGQITPAEVLNNIFKHFCIGK